MTVGFGTLTDPAWQGEVAIPGELPPAPGQSTWPRMITLARDDEDRLVTYLFEEIDRARVERAPLIDDWVAWQAQYWANPAQGVKNWPFPRAANVVIPLTAIAVEAVYARLFNTLFATEPFYTIRPKATAWIEMAPKVEEWFQTEMENPRAINMFGFLKDALMELCKLGTVVGKSGYERFIRKSLDPDTDEERWVEVHNGATLDYVPIANFLIRLQERDPQTAPWVGEEHILTWVELKRMALSGRIDPKQLEKVKTYFLDNSREQAGEALEYEDDVDQITNQEPIWREQFKLQEVWMQFDVDNDGVDEEIVVDFHWQSQTPLAIRYNWYTDLHRPYRHVNYIPMEGRIYGLGIAKQNDQFQAEVTTIHRQRLDNSTLANMGMIALKKNSGYGPKEPIFPGKMWFLDNVDDIAPVKLSEVYNSAYANEDILVRYSEMRTGVNEVVLGQPQQGTPGTATGDLTRLAEGNKRFDLVMKQIRRWLSGLGQDMLANYQQFGDQERHWLILGDDGVFVEHFLQMPTMMVRDGALVEVTATDSITNKQVEQQNWMALMQLLEKYYTGNMMLAAQIDPQLAAMFAMGAIQASGEAIKRLLTTFNVLDAEKLLINPLEQMQSGPGNAGQLGVAGQPQVGGLIGPAQPNGNAGVGAIPASPNRVGGF